MARASQSFRDSFAGHMLFYEKCTVFKDTDLEGSQLNSYARAADGLIRVVLNLPRIRKEFGMKIALKLVATSESIAPPDKGRARDGERQKKEVHKMREVRLPKNLGMILLGIWLIMYGLIPLLHFNFRGLPLVMAIFAIATGVLILFGR